MHTAHVALLIAFLALDCGRQEPKPAEHIPAVQTQSRPAPAFDGGKAFSYLKAQTDFGPRVPETPAHGECLAYIQRVVQQYAAAVNLQRFDHPGYDGVTLHLTNIIASFNLEAKTRILLIAHWDSRPRADQDRDPAKRRLPIDGANDGASGVAILIEIARHLKATPPDAGVDMLFVDGEDYGKEGDTPNYLLGARYFADHLPPGFHPAFGILLDMVGDRQLEIPKEPYSMKYAPDIVDLVWSTAHALGIAQFTDDVQGWVTDDHLPLNEAGIKTVDLIDFNYPDSSNRYWHTTQDTPDKCSPESLEAVGKVLMAVIYQQPA